MKVHNNPHTIKRLPLSFREKMNDNRNQKGFHVCLSRFFLEFKKAEKTQQHEHLAETLCAEGLPSVANCCTQALDDDASIDSTDSSVCVRHEDVMKAACVDWSDSFEAVRKLGICRRIFQTHCLFADAQIQCLAQEMSWRQHQLMLCIWI